MLWGSNAYCGEVKWLRFVTLLELNELVYAICIVTTYQAIYRNNKHFFEHT